jgi:hypothetical protein
MNLFPIQRAIHLFMALLLDQNRFGRSNASGTGKTIAQGDLDLFLRMDSDFIGFLRRFHTFLSFSKKKSKLEETKELR